MKDCEARMTHGTAAKRTGFWANASGVASVEFALLGTTLLLMLAGGFDVAFMASAARDAERTSMLLARVLVTCPDTSCALVTIPQYIARETNALPRYPNAAIGMAMIQRTNGAIKICGGNMTYLESDVSASALNVMKDGDIGAAVYVTTNYTSILPNFVTRYIASTGVSYRKYTIDVRGNGSACV